MKRILFSFLLLSCIQLSQAQTFTLDADIRPRFEFRHGFGNLFPDDAKAAAFVTQRSRLNFGYGDEKLQVYFSVQDVSTWGDTRQLAINDGNESFSLFQAWLSYSFTETWALKLGRQVISYDDQRILGGVDWAMQGRFHDAAMLKFSKNKFDVDLAFAYNQQDQKIIGSEYNINGFYSYKLMQMAHFQKAWDKGNISFLFMNNGFQKYTEEANPLPDGVYYRQTTGTYFNLPVSFFTLTGSAYLQTGKATASTDLSAYQYMLEAKFKPGKVNLTLGFESLSGTDQGGEEKNNSFFPLYGTNHKFNGYMDYFYVGNHANNVGLNNLYGKIAMPTGETSGLGLDVHFFSSQAQLADNQESYLGTELDLVYNKTISKNIKMAIGYSQLFASESMSAIKGGISSDNTNNWGWVQLIVNPRLLSYSIKED
ncbi:alginate export family protein [Algoriphagus pacificus]|uniref:Alginate export family protein n=1 Tax=Algoriphagus pacificus TaxID=2811234 RepID=A0ABS3CBI8_9BACT|nr:alginate export family protein [Algoriphagus pacificus]MBN7814478.1 alginate export family protein [Algoriphagus pacificus]